MFPHARATQRAIFLNRRNDTGAAQDKIESVPQHSLDLWQAPHRRQP